MKSRRHKLSKQIFRPPEYQIKDPAFFNDDPRAANALAVAHFVFEIEKHTKEGILRRADLPLYKGPFDFPSLKHTLEALLVYVLVEDINIHFRKVRLKNSSPPFPPSTESTPSVCLFSGGTDSFVGLLLANQRLRNVEAVFCAHSDQSRIIHIVKMLHKKVFEREGIPIRKLGVSPVGTSGYAQLRGFLYIVSAAAWMHVLNGSTLIVTECGPTMYQPQFSPFDSVTMTTHPVVMDYARDVIKILLGRDVQIITPFENLTKAETLAICPNPNGLKYTHSCISQRFGRHDGTCYGCVIRRLAAIAANVPDVRYNKNPIIDRKANSGNLLSLMVFCFDILTHYNDMPSFQTENIEAYGKQDLFKRFALDNFAAIHCLLRERRRVRSSLRHLYKALVNEIGEHTLDKRLKILREGKFTPSF